MTQDEIIEMAREAGMDYLQHISPSAFAKVETFAKLVAAKEREACAKVCENLRPFGSEMDMQIATMKDCADAIRARGNA